MTIMIGSCDKCYPWELDNLPEAELNGLSFLKHIKAEFFTYVM